MVQPSHLHRQGLQATLICGIPNGTRTGTGTVHSPTASDAIGQDDRVAAAASAQAGVQHGLFWVDKQLDVMGGHPCLYIGDHK